MKTANKRFSGNTLCCGSALILTVVLTSLLAIVGVLFVMVSRVDKMATSAISENKQLDLALETVVARISQELASDVPRADPNGQKLSEYYDYPGPADRWLACLEPYPYGPDDYRWRQISDIYGKLTTNRDLPAAVVPDYQDAGIMREGVVADADGDGVADSIWVVLPNMSSGKGKPIYVAVRIVDNGAMLNVNTAFKFEPGDPNAAIFDIGGSSQMQINLMALAGRPGDPCTAPVPAEEIALLMARANNGLGVNALDLRQYEQNVIWRYGGQNGLYTPFDISDELELRYRFLLNHTAIDTRLEAWGGEFRGGTLLTPIQPSNSPDPQGRQQQDNGNLADWLKRSYGDGSIDPSYAYRHIATTYNMDRIINPVGPAFNGGKMVNVNIADANLIYAAIRRGLLDASGNLMVADADGFAAQLAVNIVDFRDDDTQVTCLPMGPRTYCGFEAQPFISEIAFRISSTDTDVSTNNHFAVELYNPFDVDIPLSNFRLELRRQNQVVRTVNLAGYAIADGSRFVISSGSSASTAFGVAGLMSTGGGKEDTNLVLAEYDSQGTDPPTYALRERYDIYLLRTTTSAQEIYLDKQETQDSWFDWDSVRDVQQFYARADNDWNVVYQNFVSASNTLGGTNQLSGGRKNYNFANSLGYFITVGDIAKALTVAPSADPCDMIGMRVAAEPAEEAIRLDLRNPAFANIFNYLTVFDPSSDGIDNDGDLQIDGLDISGPEWKVPGRININTAPWFVIAQLPWMEPLIAQAIVAYRDTTAGGFESIGGLTQVPQMGYYVYDPAHASADLDRFPDLTPSDGAVDDFEERDVIFSRISNLVTVRSDVFTAYILVRIGADGPQKRAIAILDRSNVYSSYDKVKIIALHPVPDPR